MICCELDEKVNNSLIEKIQALTKSTV
jgi:hypothetical protein